MDSEADRQSVWQDTVGGIARRAEWGHRSTPVSSSSPAEPRRRNDAASDGEFVAILVPCLQLVAPVGMTVEAQGTWLEAARMALSDYSAVTLRDAARQAMKEADHPSKIVPAIVKAISAERASRYQPMATIERPERALPAPGGERCTKDELDAICRQHGVGRYAKEESLPGRAKPLSLDPARECRAPTRADYLRMGVSAEALDGMGMGA